MLQGQSELFEAQVVVAVVDTQIDHGSEPLSLVASTFQALPGGLAVAGLDSEDAVLGLGVVGPQHHLGHVGHELAALGGRVVEGEGGAGLGGRLVADHLLDLGPRVVEPLLEPYRGLCRVGVAAQSGVGEDLGVGQVYVEVREPLGAGPDLSVGRPHLRVALAEGRVQRLKPLLAVDPSVLLLCVDAVIARLLLGHGVAHPQDVTATGLRQDLS